MSAGAHQTDGRDERASRAHPLPPEPYDPFVARPVDVADDVSNSGVMPNDAQAEHPLAATTSVLLPESISSEKVCSSMPLKNGVRGGRR